MSVYLENIGKEWLDDLPKNWKIDRLKDVCEKVVGGGTPKSSVSEYWENGNVIWISPTDFSKQKNNKFINNSERKITQLGLQKSSATLIPKGTVIMSSRASIGEAKIAKCAVSTNQGFVSYIPSKKLNSTYLFYIINAHLGNYFLKIASGTTFMEISRRQAKLEYIPLPSIDNQIEIVNYLDKTCENIDRTIELKEKQIVKIETYYYSLIKETVSKGLDKSNEAKSTYIEEIGAIPKHWAIKRLFNICSFVRGNSTFGKNELLDEGKYVALQYGKTYKVEEINEQFKFYVNDEFYKSSQVVNYGDTIFVSTSETMEDLGHSVFYNRKDVGLIGGEQILLKPNKNILDGKYLFYSSKVFGKGLKKFATGIKVFRFDVYDLKTIYTPLPPLKEQIQIASYLEKTTDKVNKIKEKLQAQIDTLKEYKKSLIYEYVTGKKQVKE